MNWTNVKLIFCREVRDQLRDRRTLFMIAVLPLLLYPLLGMSFLQISQFLREHATKVLLVGMPDTTSLPALVNGERFSEDLFVDRDRAKVLAITKQADTSKDEAQARERAQKLAQEGKFDVVVYFPPTFASQLADFRQRLQERGTTGSAEVAGDVPDPVIYYNEAKEKSGLAFRRVQMVMQSWRESIGRQILSDSHLPAAAAKPFEMSTNDVAERTEKQAALWSKILPFVLLLWALTGAFYPAVDLCAGEKERGTLETLLSSPAERSEIVWGKLLTIMLFSVATAVLNMMSMGLTGSFVLSQLPNFGAPPLWAIPVLLAALLPMAALYSALCLALAAFARSTKEGQYYLMPLVLITMPLTILPMSPGFELNLGNSLIPVTGVVLLLRTLLEGNWWQALPYIPPVVIVTLGCCLLAVRWAADQFNAESVLFRESERFDLGLWIRRMMEDRGETPSVPQAVACGIMILMLQFFMNFAMMDKDLTFMMRAAVPQFACILTPALLMTIMLTTNVRKTLLIRVPHLGAIAAAVLLAVCVHPLSFALREVVNWLYPIPEGVTKQIEELLQGTTLTQLILFVGILPAFCEEIAFRGFILSGLRHMGHKWRAIVVSSLFFGIAHSIFQQSLVAALLGTAIAYAAVQTGSIVPGILFHMLHNTMQVVAPRGWLALQGKSPIFDWFINPEALAEKDHEVFGVFLYRWPVMVVAAVGLCLVFYWLHKLPYARSQEESLQESIDEFDAKDVDLPAASAAAGS
jgi:sodium transport system permease protein